MAHDKEKADKAFKVVNSIRDEIKALQKMQREAIEKLNKAVEEFVLIRWGVKKGSLVTCKGVIYRVVQMQIIVHEDADEKPWLRGSLKKKDGNFGTSIRGIGNEWELCPDGETSKRPGND